MKIEGNSLSSQLQMLRGAQPIAPVRSEKTTEVSQGQSFADMLSHQLKSVNEQGVSAEKQIERSALGEEPNPHATIIAVQKATISFQLLMSVKQKIEQAYQQVVRTQM